MNKNKRNMPELQNNQKEMEILNKNSYKSYNDLN